MLQKAIANINPAIETEAQNRRAASNMENFKAAIMKLLDTAPNTVLSETSKTLLQEKFSQFISLLNNPDHPPYAWMIERALRELNEKGGSSEDSISKFIRKEYDDLPWSHSTMLKHHLAQLCESGELVLTFRQKYLLAGPNSNGKIRTKCRRRKRGWDREINRRKRQRKVTRKENTLQKGDKVELLSGQQKSHEATSVHEGDCTTEGSKQQNLESKISKDTVKICIAEDNGDNSNSDAPSNVPSSLMVKDGENNLPELRLQQPSSEPIAGRSASGSPNAQLVLESKKLEHNQTEFSIPERPPGFEPGTLEESSHFQPQTAVSSQIKLHSEQLNQDSAHDFCDVDGQPSMPEVSYTEESLPTDNVQRYSRRYSRRLRKSLSGDQTSLIPSAELHDGFPPKPELSDQGRVRSKGQISVEHQLEKQVDQGNQPSRVLRPRSRSLKHELSNGKTTVTVLTSHDQHQRQKPGYPRRGRLPKAKPDTEVTNGLNISIHQNNQDLILEGTKSEPSSSKGTIKDKLLLQQQQFGLRGRGRPQGQPPKDWMLTKVVPDRPVIRDIAISDDLDQQHHEHPPQPLMEKLDITTEEMALPKSVDDPQLEQQLEKRIHGGPPKPKEGRPSMVLKFKLKQGDLGGKTRYRGRGRPRFTDQR